MWMVRAAPYDPGSLLIAPDPFSAEDYLFPEDLELDDLAMETGQSGRPEEQLEKDHTDYGSDDEEYQQLLMDVALEVEQGGQQEATAHESGREMDVAMG